MKIAHNTAQRLRVEGSGAHFAVATHPAFFTVKLIETQDKLLKFAHPPVVTLTQDHQSNFNISVKEQRDYSYTIVYAPRKVGHIIGTVTADGEVVHLAITVSAGAYIDSQSVTKCSVFVVVDCIVIAFHESNILSA